MLIDGSEFGDEGVDVSDADEHSDVAIRLALCSFDLIEIAGSVVVDGRPEKVSQVADIFSSGNLRRMGAQI